MIDLEDLEDLLEIGADIPGFSNVAPGEGPLIATIYVLGIVSLLVVMWMFCGFTRRNIGRKAGLKRDWMAFVPFARTVYFLEVVGEQWWKMFIFESWLLWYLVIGWVFNLFHSEAMTTFGNVLKALYLFGVIGYKIYFRIKFCKSFSLKSELALGMAATPWGALLRRVFECMIAFTDLFRYGDASKQRHFGEVTVSGVQMREVFGGASGSVAKGGGSSGAGCSISGLSGMYAGQDIPMVPNDELIIGRDASLASVIIDQMADKVSRKHCGIRFDAIRNVYMVTDYSSNGTLVEGGSRLAANVPQPCNRGTILILGSRENRFKLN